MGALWSRGSVNLFSCAVHHKGQTKSMLYSTNYKGKDKFAIGVFLHEIFSDEEIANYIKTNPFRTSISVNGIFNMHVLVVDGSKTQLCKNFAYHKMGAKADINIERNEHKYSDNDEM